jgi:DNA-binding XRE family transcriptional regulator
MKFDGHALTKLIVEEAAKKDVRTYVIRKKLKRKLGIIRQTLSHWENNKNNPSLKYIPLIKDFFGLNLMNGLYKDTGGK